jgi:hypothetical protein
MVLNLSAVCAAVATVTRCRVLKALFEMVKEIIGKMVRFLDSSDNEALPG